MYSQGRRGKRAMAAARILLTEWRARAPLRIFASLIDGSDYKADANWIILHGRRGRTMSARCLEATMHQDFFRALEGFLLSDTQCCEAKACATLT